MSLRKSAGAGEYIVWRGTNLLCGKKARAWTALGSESESSTASGRTQSRRPQDRKPQTLRPQDGKWCLFRRSRTRLQRSPIHTGFQPPSWTLTPQHREQSKQVRRACFVEVKPQVRKSLSSADLKLKEDRTTERILRCKTGDLQD